MHAIIPLVDQTRHRFSERQAGRDPEDCGEWTPISYYSGTLYETANAALAAAERVVPWLARRVNQNPSLRELLKKTPELQIRTLPSVSGTLQVCKKCVL